MLLQKNLKQFVFIVHSQMLDTFDLSSKIFFKNLIACILLLKLISKIKRYSEY